MGKLSVFPTNAVSESSGSAVYFHNLRAHLALGWLHSPVVFKWLLSRNSELNLGSLLLGGIEEMGIPLILALPLLSGSLLMGLRTHHLLGMFVCFLYLSLSLQFCVLVLSPAGTSVRAEWLSELLSSNRATHLPLPMHIRYCVCAYICVCMCQYF